MQSKKILRPAAVALVCLTVQGDLKAPAAGVAVGVFETSDNTSAASGGRTEDLAPPTIEKVTGSDTFDRITVAYSEPVNLRRSTEVSNYQLSDEVTIFSAAQLDPATVRLMTSRMEPERNYTLTVAHVSDLAGNYIAAPDNEITFPTFTFTTGLAKSELWTGIGGETVADLLTDPRFPGEPDLVEYALKLEWGAKDQEGVGVRLSAYLTPPESGNYVFYMAASHEAELYLSPDQDRENRAVIAAEHTPHLARSWSTTNSGFGATANTRPGCPDACENRSAAIRLEAGKRYRIELIFTDGIGVGYSGVSWAKEGEPPPINGTGLLSRNLLGVYADPGQPAKGSESDSQGNKITDVSFQDGNIVIEFSGGTLESAAEITGPWESVGDAASPVSVPVADGKKFYRVRQ